MFFFTNYSVQSVLMIFILFFSLLFLNEVSRRNKWVSIAIYILMPILLAIFVWPKALDSEATSGNWFAWVKTLSALTGVIGFMAIRYIKKLHNTKFMYIFPGLILSLNIAEAIYRDIEIFSKTGVVENGLFLLGGTWNILNATAGVISILTITGWCGIRIAKNKGMDMIWPDQLWFWIIAYDIWNVAYTYNCISDRSMYAGVIILTAATVASIIFKRGAWLQHRAQTLALWTMFTLTFPDYTSSPWFSIKSTHNPSAYMLLSSLALIVGVCVLFYTYTRAFKLKKNPFTNDIFTNLDAHKKSMIDESIKA